MATKTVSIEDFKVAFRRHPAGVGIVTGEADGKCVAMTVSSLFSVGIEPPTLVFSASALSSATPTILNVKTVVIHMVGAEQLELAKLGSTSGIDRFGEGIEWGRLPTGEPYYPGAPTRIRGRVAQTVKAGGSHLVVVEALEVWNGVDDSTEPEIQPLVYHNRSWHMIGDSL